MLSLDPEILDRLQEAAAKTKGIFDPVFSMDESSGTLGIVCQVDSITASIAAHRGTELFERMLRSVGVGTEDVDGLVESISTYHHLNDPSNFDGGREDDLYSERGSRT